MRPPMISPRRSTRPRRLRSTDRKRLHAATSSMAGASLLKVAAVGTIALGVTLGGGGGSSAAAETMKAIIPKDSSPNRDDYASDQYVGDDWLLTENPADASDEGKENQFVLSTQKSSRERTGRQDPTKTNNFGGDKNKMTRRTNVFSTFRQDTDGADGNDVSYQQTPKKTEGPSKRCPEEDEFEYFTYSFTFNLTLSCSADEGICNPELGLEAIDNLTAMEDAFKSYFNKEEGIYDDECGALFEYRSTEIVYYGPGGDSGVDTGEGVQRQLTGERDKKAQGSGRGTGLCKPKCNTPEKEKDKKKEKRSEKDKKKEKRREKMREKRKKEKEKKKKDDTRELALDTVGQKDFGVSFIANTGHGKGKSMFSPKDRGRHQHAAMDTLRQLGPVESSGSNLDLARELRNAGFINVTDARALVLMLEAYDWGAGFGMSVAIDGDNLFVGAPFEHNVTSFEYIDGGFYVKYLDDGYYEPEGSVYSFTRSILQAKLVADFYFENYERCERQGRDKEREREERERDGARRECDGAKFGWSSAITGNTAIVGAPGSDRGPRSRRTGLLAEVNSGSAFIFTFSRGRWRQKTALLAKRGNRPAKDDQFGFSVDIDSDTAVVGAPGGQSVKGTAYVFTRSRKKWSQQAKLKADDGKTWDRFGTSVAIGGNTIVVGADSRHYRRVSSVYIFTRSSLEGAAWEQRDKLVIQREAAYFGKSVAIDDGTIVVGAPTRLKGGFAYVFTHSGGKWRRQAELSVNSTHGGVSVAVDGDTAVVGSWDNAAYVFTRSDGKWSQQAKLQVEDSSGYRCSIIGEGSFGSSVAVSGNTVVVGASGYKSIGEWECRGFVYVFTRSGNTWEREPQ